MNERAQSSQIAPDKRSTRHYKRAAAILLAVIIATGITIAVYAATSTTPGTIQVKTNDSTNYDKPASDPSHTSYAPTLDGVTVHIRAYGSSRDICSRATPAGSGPTGTSGVSSGGIITFTGCAVTHGSKGKEKYLVSYAAKSGYVESSTSPIKQGTAASVAFVVKSRQQVIVKIHMVLGGTAHTASVPPPTPGTTTPSSGYHKFSCTAGFTGLPPGVGFINEGSAANQSVALSCDPLDGIKGSQL